MISNFSLFFFSLECLTWEPYYIAHFRKTLVFISEINEKYFQAPTPLSQSEVMLQPTEKRSGQVCLNTLTELMPFTGKSEIPPKDQETEQLGLKCSINVGKRSVPLQTAAIVF